MEDKLTALETRIAYQDKTIDELSDIVVMLRDTVEKLQRQVTRLENAVENLSADREENAVDERPPHY